MEITAMARGDVAGKNPAQTINEVKRPPDPAVEAAAAGCFVDAKSDRRTKAKKKGETKPRGPPKRHTEVIGAYSIPDLCRLHGGMSEAFFHKLVGDGDGPRLMRVGTRTMVSAEAAADWRREREATVPHQTAA
jgi:hypothetical protein